MDDYPPVHPGFTMTSDGYELMFLTFSAVKNNQLESLPFDINGSSYERAVFSQLMSVILDVADDEGDDFEKFRSELEDQFRTEGFIGLATEETTVNIFDEPFFPRPKGHMRRIKISFFDLENTSFEFILTRKTDIKTLQDLALNAVTSNVTNHLMINKMKIPETFKMTLRTEFYNEWSRKRFPSYNITLLPFAESLKAGGIDARTLDQIMDDYMFRIEMTQQMLSTGFPDLNGCHMT